MYENFLFSILIIVLFFSDKFLVVKFVFCYLVFCCNSIKSIAIVYFKFVFGILNFLLIISYVPVFVQYSFYLNYFFSYVWHGFLLISIYFLILSFTIYCFTYFLNRKHEYPLGFKYVLRLFIFGFLKFTSSCTLIILKIFFKV